MEEFDQEDVRACIYMLSKAETPSEAVLAWTILQKRNQGLSAMVSLNGHERLAIPASVKKYMAQPNNYLVPYFSSEKIYFLDDELLSGMFTEGEFKFHVDYTLMFDTNVATYVNKLIRGEPLGDIQSRFITLVDDILHDDLNFDHLFYMVENVKNVIRQVEHSNASKLNFWRSLDKNFRKNMVSLQLFRSIDCKEYKRTSNPKPQFSYRKAARNAVDFCYDFYVSEVGKDHILNFVLLQRMILLQLIGMVKIQLSSGKNAKSKMSEYFKYVHAVVGAYFDREAIIAHKYFSDRNSIGILEKIKKGCSKVQLLKRLDNIAWDMAAPRFMEKLIITPGEGRYFIPMFLTFDSNLRELLGHYLVKGVVFNRGSGSFAPVPEINTKDYFKQHGCLDEIEYLYSQPVRSERLSRAKPTRLSIHKLIRREYKTLRNII